MQGAEGAGRELTVIEIMQLTSVNAEYVHRAICPACHVCMETVFAGSSGQECWCPTNGCNVGFRYDADGQFERIVLCPNGWVGEDA
jgi:hypothetical protein